MYLLAPANAVQLMNRAMWFKKPFARELAQEKGVEFGYELKGQPETITEAPDLYWGYHLPNMFATEWYYHPERRVDLLKRLSHLVKLNPQYLNFHGVHLLWQPPAEQYIHRYANYSDAEEHLKVLDSNIEFYRELKKLFPNTRITLENYPPFVFYHRDNCYTTMTYLYTGTGRLKDMLYLKEKAGVEILLDIEHLILTLNFINRERNYADIPVKKIEELSEIDKKLYEIYGYYTKRDFIPYADGKIQLEDMVKTIGAKIYHVTGGVQDTDGKKIITHVPIELNDQIFRQNLRLILAQKPEAILNEVADSSTGKEWDYLRPNETEISFENLCQILLEEIK